jgi:hypothetical protein
MLSMVRFLFHLFSLSDARQAWQTQLSTGNKPLLQRIMEYQRYKTYFLNATSNADWDFVQAIVATTCTQMHIVPFFAHAKGHQDNKTACSNLSLEAQLNVDVDHEALAPTIRCTQMMNLLFASFQGLAPISLSMATQSPLDTGKQSGQL